MAEKLIYPDDLLKSKDLVGKRIWNAIQSSGSNPNHWNAVTVDEAWLQTANEMNWGDYLKNKNQLLSGLIEREIILADGKLVAVAFIGLKDIGRPDGWREGVLRGNGVGIRLGHFPNQIKG